MSKKDDKWFIKHFPSAMACEVADKAIDKLDVALPMSNFIDAWIDAYVKAGGRTDIKGDK